MPKTNAQNVKTHYDRNKEEVLKRKRDRYHAKKLKKSQEKLENIVVEEPPLESKTELIPVVEPEPELQSKSQFIEILVEPKVALLEPKVALLEPIPITIDNPTQHIDHRDGCRINNCLSNLRVVTNQQNQWNRTNAKGYYWNKQHQKYQAQIHLNNKPIHLGYFLTEEEARTAYQAQIHLNNKKFKNIKWVQ